MTDHQFVEGVGWSVLLIAAGVWLIKLGRRLW